MATIKVSALSAKTSPAGTEEILINDSGTSKKITVDNITENNFTDTLKAKVDGIEASADVTDATNVNAAGALMLSDTTTAGLGIVVDEDNMASNLNTKVPTQQSVKAYVDASSGGDTLPVADTTGIAKGSADATKIVRFEVDGLTNNTTRVLTVQDKNGTIALSADITGDNSNTNTGDEVAASATVAGVVELATIAEVNTGSDTVRTITPAGLAGSALQTKVDAIEASADVTDATNVTAAGALMDSEVTNLADVKAFAFGSTVQAYDADTTKNDVENTFTKTQIWYKGADVSSATALDISDGNYHDVTGTTTVTSIGTVGVGATIKLHFDGAVILTHHANDLVIPGGANFTTSAGDEIEFTEYASGDWRVTGFALADGKAFVAGGATGLDSVGSVARATSGLLFNSDTAAVNVLDDYEEGTFNVTFTAGSGTISADGGDDTMGYVKVGNICHIQGRTHINAISSPSGEFFVAGLPFTSASLAENADVIAASVGYFTISGSVAVGFYGELGAGATSILVYNQTATGRADAAGMIGADAYIYLSFSYQTA